MDCNICGFSLIRPVINHIEVRRWPEVFPHHLLLMLNNRRGISLSRTPLEDPNQDSSSEPQRRAPPSLECNFCKPGKILPCLEQSYCLLFSDIARFNSETYISRYQQGQVLDCKIHPCQIWLLLTFRHSMIFYPFDCVHEVHTGLDFVRQIRLVLL